MKKNEKLTKLNFSKFSEYQRDFGKNFFLGGGQRNSPTNQVGASSSSMSYVPRKTQMVVVDDLTLGHTHQKKNMKHI